MQQAKCKFLYGHRIDFCFVLSCKKNFQALITFLKFIFIAEDQDDFLLNSYVHFSNCHFRSQLLLPYNPFTVYQFILAFTTLHSFISMDFLPALLLPFSRTALHMLSMRCSTGIIAPCENWPSLFFFTVLCIQSLIQAKISPLFSLVQFAFQAFKGLCQKLFVNPHCEKVMVKAQHSILFTIRLHPLYIEPISCLCVSVCKNQITISLDMWNILSYR